MRHSIGFSNRPGLVSSVAIVNALFVYAIYSVVKNKHDAIRGYALCSEKNLTKVLENHISRVYSHTWTLHM